MTIRRLRPLLAAFALMLAVPLAADAKTKPLGPGTKGDAVGVLQTYLADQGYLPWTAVQGGYDYRTTQAVMAFQGWNGLSRTGKADLRR